MLKNILTTLMILLLIVASVQAQSKKEKKPSFFDGKNNNISFSAHYFLIKSLGKIYTDPSTGLQVGFGRNYYHEANEIFAYERNIIKYKRVILSGSLAYGFSIGFGKGVSYSFKNFNFWRDTPHRFEAKLQLGYIVNNNSFIFANVGQGKEDALIKGEDYRLAMLGYKYKLKNDLTLSSQIGLAYFHIPLFTTYIPYKPNFSTAISIGYQFGK